MPEKEFRGTLVEKALSALEARLDNAINLSAEQCELQCKRRYPEKIGKQPKLEGDRKKEKTPLEECLEECKAIEVAVDMMAKLHKELNKTFIEIIWEGGDIDPKPLEKSIRERFSSPHNK